MITVARKFMVDRCERCGRLALLNLVRDDPGRQMLLCRDCISLLGKQGLTDPLGNIRWPEGENATLPER